MGALYAGGGAGGNNHYNNRNNEGDRVEYFNLGGTGGAGGGGNGGGWEGTNYGKAVYPTNGTPNTGGGEVASVLHHLMAGDHAILPMVVLAL